MSGSVSSQRRSWVLLTLALLMFVALAGIPPYSTALAVPALQSPPSASLGSSSPAAAPGLSQPEAPAITSTRPVSGTWQPIAGAPRSMGRATHLVVAPNGDRYVSASMLYRNGLFRNGLFRWHVGAWSQIAPLTYDVQIVAMVWGHDSLYVAGNFSAIAGVPADRLARWDGQQWSAVGSGFTAAGNNGVRISDLAFAQDTLYIAGSFASFNGVPATNLVRWDGAAASAFGNPLLSPDDIAADGSNVYLVNAGTVGGVSASPIAGWNGTQWFTMTAGLVFPTKWPELVAAGAGRVVIANGRYVAEWSGTEWVQLPAQGGGLAISPREVGSLALVGSSLYAGLKLPFDMNSGFADYEYALHHWDGVAWEQLGRQLSIVTAMAVGPDGLYVSAIPNQTAPVTTALWRLEDDDLIPLDLPLEAMLSVTALAVSGDTAYVQGWFDYTDVHTATSLMEWESGAWDNLWPRLSPPIAGAALGPVATGADGELYGIAELANNTDQVIRYDGSQWLAVTLPITPADIEESGYEFTSLHVISPTAIYLTGSLYGPDPLGAAQVAFWNGAAWTLGAIPQKNYATSIQPCGEHLYLLAWSKWPSGFVEGKELYELNPATLAATKVTGISSHSYSDIGAVACLGADVYLGGHFLEGAESDYLLRWNGTTTEAITASGRIYALAVRGSTLYAGGRFTSIGGVSANNIARWDGATWQALGSGVTGLYEDPAYSIVSQLEVSGDDLYVGGAFMHAGGQPAQSLAIWHAEPVIVVPPTTRLFLPMLSR